LKEVVVGWNLHPKDSVNGEDSVVKNIY